MKSNFEAAELKKMQARYRRLQTQLAQLGPILLGTITERVINRDPRKPGELAKSFGPYYQWTFKEAGKTVTVNLTAEQAESFGQAIARHRLAEEILAEMRTLSRLILEATTSGVKRRKQ